MNTGWLCPRCSASNAPSVSRCGCSPVQTLPITTPWVPPVYPQFPSDYDWLNPVYTRPYRITWTSAGTGPINWDEMTMTYGIGVTQ